MAVHSMDEISPGLFLGNLVAAQDADHLVAQGITHVLSLTSERVHIPAWCGIVHKQFRVRDTRRQNLLAQLLEGVQFVEDAFTGVLPTLSIGDKTLAPDAVPPLQERDVKVFVHCRMGISRSGSIIIAYVMKHHLMPYHKALSFVRDRRSIVNPNQGFAAQLAFLESSGFDLTHLGEDLLAQSIDNPYDGAESESHHHRRGKRSKKPWEREPGKWVPVAFASNEDKARFLEGLEETTEEARQKRALERVGEIAKSLEIALMSVPTSDTAPDLEAVMAEEKAWVPGEEDAGA